MFFTQDGNQLSGRAVVNHLTVEGELTLVEETVEGEVSQEGGVFMRATSAGMVRGDSDVFLLDSWVGEFVDENTIVGTSEDEEGTVGAFTMTRSDVYS